MFATVLKFNPNHDSKGRFASSGGGSAVSGKDITASAFVSPNKTDYRVFSQAVAMLHSPEQRNLAKVSKKIDEKLKLSSYSANAVGAWADGAENALSLEMKGNVDWETLRVATAMKGALAEQKAVLPFQVKEGGKDSLYHIDTTSTDLVDIHKTLLAQGIGNHTLVPQKSGTRIIIFDQGSTITKDAIAIGKHYETTVTRYKGQGEFIGSWTSREEGAKDYAKIIEAYGRNRGQDKIAFWEKLRNNWGKA